MPNYRRLLVLTQPIHLLLAILTYSLGGGIARYLGHAINAAAFGLGLFALLAIQTASYWLVEYFQLPMRPLDKEETPRLRNALRASLFLASMALLTVSGAVILTMFITGLLSLQAVILVGVFIFCFFVYAVPPMRLSEAGFGEIILAIAWGTLFPSLAYLIQAGEFHRILMFTTFPLTLLGLAYLLVSDFPHFGIDQKYGRRSLLIRLNWQLAIPIHHLLILLSFLIFASATFLGFPWALVAPVFLALPFAIIQVIWLQRIAAGGRTLWRFIVPFSAAVFGLTIYLLTLTFWIR